MPTGSSDVQMNVKNGNYNKLNVFEKWARSQKGRQRVERFSLLGAWEHRKKDRSLLQETPHIKYKWQGIKFPIYNYS